MGRNFLILMCGLFLFSCSDSLENGIESNEFVFQSTNLHENSYFDNVTRPENWKRHQSLEDMIDACQLPPRMLDTISTENLIQLCYDYPLHSIYLAYNNQMDGINCIVNSFNGFEELKKRADAAEKMIDFYDKLYVPIYVTRANSGCDYRTMKLEYFECLLSSNFIPEIYSKQYQAKLENAAQSKLRVKKSMPEIYGRKSLNVTNKIIENNLLQNVDLSGASNVDTNSSVSSLQVSDMITVYTLWGTPVEGMLFSELTSNEINSLDTYYRNTFPNAIFLKSSSKTYNCHSYAWNMTDGGKTCWINHSLSNDATANSNLKKYWSDPIGYNETTEVNATRIHYYLSDHSAIKSSVAGYYESKWGMAPLMRHAPEYGPYSNMKSRHYYAYSEVIDAGDVYHGNLICDSGVGATTIGEANRYFTGANYKNTTIKWRIENGKEVDVTGDSSWVKISVSGTSAVVTFYQMGLFNVFCEFYYKNSLIAQYSFQALVEP